MRNKLQNSKCYAESPDFLPALGLFISRRSPSLQLEVNYIPSSLDYQKTRLQKKIVHIHVYIYIRTMYVLVYKCFICNSYTMVVRDYH